MKPKYTPFDGSKKSFAIELSPLDLANWIEVDDDLPRYLTEKRRLITDIPDQVWAGDFSSEPAQREVLGLLVPHLLERFPEKYQQAGNVVSITDAVDVDLDDVSQPPLQLAALLVQEDLVLMRHSPQGWRLVAASLCFPSSWILREKMGKVLHDVHEPVPGFQKGTRNAHMIERIFDNLLVDQPVERFNWSVYGDDALYHADHYRDHFPAPGEGDPEFFLRIEHQTLRKLPVSGDILFTIRIHIDPLEILEKRVDKATIARNFIKTLDAMNNDQNDYKGINKGRDALIARLSEMANSG